MSTLTKFTEGAFDTEVLGADKPVLVDFYADWCGPCRAVGPLVEQIATELGDQVVVGKLDVDSSPGIAMRYQVRSIPTLGIFKGGQLLDRMVGYPGPAGVRSWVKNTLEKAAV
ncbi:MAG TPA: thioredoxin [Candidatus Dormibacteraeota bacterium]|nr:thioredoxin [Candidatus Dormibacteraeota bacterium]